MVGDFEKRAVIQMPDTDFYNVAFLNRYIMVNQM